jgi:hypothetical protein
MRLNHKCPICGKIYERDCTPEPDQICPECEVENIVNPAFHYFIAGEEVTYEEYQKFIKGE